MKRLLIVSVVAAAFLAAVSIGVAKEKKAGGKGKGAGQKVGEKQKLEAKHGQEAETPVGKQREQMKNRARHMFRERIGRLEEIRAIAAEEGATKTVAALDKLIAEDRGRFEKMRARRAEAEERMKARRPESQKRGPGRRPKEEKSEE